MSQDMGAIKVERKSVVINQEYKGRLNQLSEYVNRLEKLARGLYPSQSEKIKLLDEEKKTSPETSFLEVWQDHTYHFASLLIRLEKVVQDLEQF
jgi:hypothetical protein